MPREKRDAIEKFLKSMKHGRIKPPPDETPAERTSRVELEIRTRVVRYGDDGQLSPDELCYWATLYFEVERQRDEFFASQPAEASALKSRKYCGQA
jgi:hypothetical protein